MIVLSYQPESFREFKKVINYGRKFGADILEIRGEKINHKELIKVLNDNSFPKIFTYRINQFSYSKIKEASKKYRIAIENDVDYIDVDINLGKSLINKLKKELKKTKLIISYHNYEKTPRLKYLIQILDYSRKISADIYKIVTYANSTIDNFSILKLIEIANKKSIQLIAHCMGENGKSGRILAYKHGSLFFYSSYKSNSETASGQISLENTTRIFRIKEIYPSTRVYGIVGNPLKQSKSWLFHNFAFRITGSNAIYLNFPVIDLETFIYHIKNYVKGLSITIPFKEEILTLPNVSSKTIKEIGSANTAIFKDSKPVLFNTDYLGFNEIVKKEKKLKHSNILVIGAGGSARTIIYTLKKFDNEIFVINRNAERAESLAKEMGIHFVKNKNNIPENIDVIINTTPGNNLFILNVAKNIFTKKKIKLVVDIDLNFKESKLLAMSRQKKIKFIDGFEFFIHQAVHQFKIFTGKDLTIRKVKKFLLENYDKHF